MWPPFWRSQHFKITTGTVAALLGLCLSSPLHSQTAPLQTPAQTAYPGILQSFEKLIEIDQQKFRRKLDQLTRAGRVFNNVAGVTSIDLDPDFMNSVILHSPAGYLRLASVDKCRFYDTVLADLLRSAEGRIQNLVITYLNRNGDRETALVPKRDLLARIVTQECPQSQNLINEFQVRNLDEVFRRTNFELPSGEQQCRNVHAAWLANPRTPYLCQIHEYLKDAGTGQGNPQDLAQRQAVARVVAQKLNPTQRDYLENLCQHLDDEQLFCDEFLNVSFWGKVANNFADKIFAEDICRRAERTAQLTDPQLKQCLVRMKRENDLCLYGQDGDGLAPRMECDRLSLALNHSSLRSNYRDCAGASDQLGVTNLARILLSAISPRPVIKPFEGPCSVVSAGEAFAFNQRFDNDDKWRLEACFFDKILERDVCQQTFFGRYGDLPQSYSAVVADILRRSRGATQNERCEMVPTADYNPTLLRYKSGCFIVFDPAQCHISRCEHRIFYNDRPVDHIKLRNTVAFDYFASTVRDEKFSQHYLLAVDLKLKSSSVNTLSRISSFFQKTKKGVVHGVGCAEELLPSFFQARQMNHCTPVPFIIDGMVRQEDKTVFVTRTALDSLQAPRLVSWSNLFSAVTTYQRLQPLKLWTLYGLD
jgi:hypothetical protein